MDVRVAIDCMGGDHGAHVTVPAALGVLRGNPDASFLLVGRQDAIE
ncbi:MAG TPA: phosphate acyltransferase, partial [Burkholderiales bacterium]|nr:phosphate acyltransferase [Burkholderiales bacterium]